MVSPLVQGPNGRGAGPRSGLLSRNPSLLIFLSALALFTLLVTLGSEATGAGVISTSFVKTLGKTLCLCLAAVALSGRTCDFGRAALRAEVSI